jgi:hypothetical protein
MGNTTDDRGLGSTRGGQPLGTLKRERRKSYPLIEVDGRASAVSVPSPGPIFDARDAEQPEKIIEPEREDIYQKLQALDERSWSHEKRLDELEKTRSMPVTLSGPKGFSITGNWRLIALIAVLSAIVALTYLTLRYKNPVAFPSTSTQTKAAS